MANYLRPASMRLVSRRIPLSFGSSSILKDSSTRLGGDLTVVCRVYGGVTTACGFPGLSSTALTSRSNWPALPNSQSHSRWLSNAAGSIDDTDGDSPDSHDDFKAQSAIPSDDDDDEVIKFITNAVKNHDVLLFMKGTPEAPQCGFSARTVAILQESGVDFSSADVLSSTRIREGIKKFTEWPTIPQLFVRGDFVGGCDIITEMHQNGELKELLEPVIQEQQKKKTEKTQES